MARRYIPPVDPGLATAQGVVGGVNSFMQAFQGAQRDRRQMAMQEAQMASQRELQALQMQKLKEEIGPQEIQLQQIQLALEGMDAGVPGMDGIFKKKSAEIIDSVQTPAQAEAVRGAIGQFQSRKGGSIGADMMTGQSQPMSMGVSSPEPITLNRASRDVLEKMISARTTANLTGARIQAQESLEERRARTRAEADQAQRDYDAQKTSEKQKYQSGESEKERQLKKDLAKQRAAQANQSSVVTKLIGDITKKETELRSGGLAGLPLSGKMREEALKEAQRLKNEYKKVTGRDFGEVAAPSAGVSAPARSGTPAATPTPTPTVAPQQSGLQLPPQVQAAVDAAPEGKEMTYKGKKYKKQGGKLVEL